MQIINYYIIIINFIGLLFYGIDKFKAIIKDYRISEKILLSISILGGCIGTTIGMVIFRHKIRKSYFVITNITLDIIYIIIYKLFLN